MNDLRTLAEAATQGLWEAGWYKRVPTVFLAIGNRTTPIATVHDQAINSEGNAAFIAAANPTAIRIMLDAHAAEVKALLDRGQAERQRCRDERVPNPATAERAGEWASAIVQTVNVLVPRDSVHYASITGFLDGANARGMIAACIGRAFVDIQQVERERYAGLVEAATVARKWLEWWLAEDLCDCDSGRHVCGKAERLEELHRLSTALAALEAR